jgi:glyoxylase-like metal-dependent hydrolase (beta-lactamase superfamily II)
MRIEAIINTHVHADHRSGERRLHELVPESTIYMHADAKVQYRFHPLLDCDDVSLGNVIVRAWHTPGHTPDSISILVTDQTRATEPWMVLTGDTLFVGDVGRPDFGGEEAAATLYASLARLMTLPDYIEVFPAHISGSPCGRAMSGKPSSTIGFERRHNSALKQRDPAQFIRAIYEDLPAKPPEFEAIIAQNRG